MTTTNTETDVTTVQVHQVYIRTTPEAIWDAITQPEWSARYGYGGDVDYDLRPGGAFKVHASKEFLAAGAPEIVIDGEVLEADPPRRLVQTWRMLMDETMVSEGFTRLTFEIKETQDGVCKLTITHDLSGAPTLDRLLAGKMEDQGAGGGWSFVLSDLKTLLETGKGFATA